MQQCHAAMPCGPQAAAMRLLHVTVPAISFKKRNFVGPQRRNVVERSIRQCPNAWLRRVCAAAAGVAASLPSAAPSSGKAAPPTEKEIEDIASSLTFADLWRLVRPDWRLIAACAASTFISVATSVLVAPCLGRVIDVISAATSTNTQLATAVGTLGAVYVISNISLAAQVALSQTVGESLASRLRARLFRSLLGRGAAFHDTAKTGAMTAWLGQDVEVLQTTVAKLLGARGLRAVLETTGIVAVLAWLSFPLALALMIAAPLVGPVVAAATRGIKGAAQVSQATGSATSAAADEIVENIRVVRAFGAERRQLGRFEMLADAAHAAAKKVIGLQAVLDVSGRVRNTLCILVSLSLGSYLALAGRVSIGVCYSFFIYSFSFAFALSNVTATLGDLSKAAGTMARTLWVLRRCEADEDDTRQTKRCGATLEALRGEIEFQKVCFRHPGGWGMKDISFRVPAGNTLALVGPSGGGKSTVAALLLGLYTPDSGEILVDGVPLQSLDLSWWRRQVGVVEQEPGLLTGRVKDIVAYGVPEDANHANIADALHDAQASLFVRALPAGVATVVGPGGVELSGGQRQRIALARALLGGPAVLVLDEATSALDVSTEAAVTDALLRREGGRRRPTTVVIAHRLSTVRAADVIAVVSGGRVVEQGTPAELGAKEGGVYAGMLQRAAGGKGEVEGWEVEEAKRNGVLEDVNGVMTSPSFSSTSSKVQEASGVM